MVKVFLTGDNHFGLKFGRYSNISEQLIDSRFEALERCVQVAEAEGCGLFVVAGDLFDTVHVTKKLVTRTVDVLAKFDGTVLVLPGNHDYYTEDESLWKWFDDAVAKSGADILLLNTFEPRTLDVRGEEVVVYPAYCQSKHSQENNLGWIKQADLSADDAWKLGIAHGAIQGVTPDIKQEYFLMTREELSAVPVDAWLIGHTHVPYPALGLEDLDARETGNIYNAGTHEQSSLNNNTPGYCFVITLEKQGQRRCVRAHAVQVGRVRYHELATAVTPDTEDALRCAVAAQLEDLGENDIVRLRLSGAVQPEEYATRKALYQELQEGLLAFECNDEELSEQITMERVTREFPEMGMAHQLMEQLMDDPKTAQMAYELLRECVK